MDSNLKGLIKILLVEDEIPVRLVTTRILQNAGYTVVSTQDGNEALNQYGLNPDTKLVIIDYGLPGRKGPEVLKQFKARGYNGPAILSTGFGNSLDDRETAGFTTIVEKPLTAKKFIDAIEKTMQVVTA